MHPFCPTMCFFSLIPISAVIILYSVFIYYPLSIYTIVWRDAICHFPKHFFQPLWLSPIFLLFQIVVLQPLPVTACTLQPVPISLGALSSLTYPSWCFMYPCLALLEFLSYSSHWTLRIPSTTEVWLSFLPFLPAVFCIHSRHSVQKFDDKSCLHLDFSF